MKMEVDTPARQIEEPNIRQIACDTNRTNNVLSR